MTLWTKVWSLPWSQLPIRVDTSCLQEKKWDSLSGNADDPQETFKLKTNDHMYFCYRHATSDRM